MPAENQPAAWTCTLPRQAFFLLGQFAVAECQRTGNMPGIGLAGMPERAGAGERLRRFVNRNYGAGSCKFLLDGLLLAEDELGLDADDLAFEWASGVMGCIEPPADGPLPCTGVIVGAYRDGLTADKDAAAGLSFSKEFGAAGWQLDPLVNGDAPLSAPQQVMASLFALFAMTEMGRAYSEHLKTLS